MTGSDTSGSEAVDLDDVDTETLLAGDGAWIGPDLAGQLAAHPLECLDTEFPHYAHAVEAPGEIQRPAEQHPAFFGCFDWHSAVHSHWSLVRGLRLFDDHPREAEIVAAVDDRLTDRNVAGELDHFAENESFEKPYGWAWLLRLAAELRLGEGDPFSEWQATLAPLEERIVDLVESAFLTDSRPFRVGTHGNTAFALAAVLDYARVVGDDDLQAGATEVSREFFAEDEDYPVEYEPLGWDFLSPALTEADLLRRVLDPGAFESWLEGFLPDVRTSPYDSILDPVAVEGEGGVELHLVGLNLSKAWSLAGVAETLPADHRLVDPLEASARRHAEAGIERAFTDDYAGAHWLSSFVLYLLTREAGAIAP